MGSGILFMIAVFLFAFLIFLVGVYCHLCAETGSGGRYYGSNKNIAPTARYTRRFVRPQNVTQNNCKCSKEFSTGRRNSCDGDQFEYDEECASTADISSFRGERGFEYPGVGGSTGGADDPTWGFMGNDSASTSALDQPDYSSTGGDGED